MKLLVFAHVPPPHHGQSQMVQYLVEGLRSQPGLGVEVFHVDARLSDSLQDVGLPRGGKVLSLLGYCGRAFWLRWRHGIRTLYYVPSPPKRASLIRDWMVFALLRPWFRHLVFHWHAVGLGEWLETQGRPWERWLTRFLMGRPSLSIVLAETNRSDAQFLHSRQIRVVHNGLADPCPDFGLDLAVMRRERMAYLRAEGGGVRLLFLALCSRDKGVFDAVEAVVAANASASTAGSHLRFHLTVAGTFPSEGVEREFRERCEALGAREMVDYVGFLAGVAKEAAWRSADLFLFPTYYANEGQPVSLIEAMAFGVPAITTRWRALPEMLPSGYPGLTEPHDVAAISAKLLALVEGEDGIRLRREYEARFALSRHVEGMAAAIRSVEKGDIT